MGWGGRAARAVAAGMVATAALAVAAPAQAPGFVALSALQRGEWQLREVGGATRSLCLTDPAALFQQRHRGAQCSRFVIENGATSATVHYTCPGTGHARTTVEVATPRSVHVSSQGLEGGMPFDIEIEARRTGACAIAGR